MKKLILNILLVLSVASLSCNAVTNGPYSLVTYQAMTNFFSNFVANSSSTIAFGHNVTVTNDFIVGNNLTVSNTASISNLTVVNSLTVNTNSTFNGLVTVQTNLAFANAHTNLPVTTNVIKYWITITNNGVSGSIPVYQ